MKRYIALLLLIIPLARSSNTAPTRIEVHALPSHTTIGGTVDYVASVFQSSDVITASLTLTITARLSNISLETTPTSDCNTRNDDVRVIISCTVSSSPTVIVARGTVLGGTAQMITITGDLDGVIARDVQWVAGVKTVYLPMLP